MIDINEWNIDYIREKVIKPMFEDETFPLMLAEEIKNAIKKQIPKKALERHYEDDGEATYIKLCCPNGCAVQVSKYDLFCPRCGQKLDWSEVDK